MVRAAIIRSVSVRLELKIWAERSVIMKARKKLENHALIQEAIGQVSQRFVATVPDIKRVREHFVRST